MPPIATNASFSPGAPVAPPVSASTSQMRRVIAAATIGNVLEWYDWGAFGFLVTYISANFFPKGDDTAALLLTFATFGVGFVARPIGAIVIGRLGDVKGRKVALMTTMFMMAVGTVGIGFIPNYATIGLLAPALLVLMRLLQGFSTGGELGGSLAFMVEWAPPRRRAYYASFQQASTNAGLLIGSGLAAALNSLLPPDQMASWGWRVPFLVGSLLLPVGLWMRRNIEESPVYTAHLQAEAAGRVEQPRKTPLAAIAQAIGFIISLTACQYIILTYLATFIAKFGGLTLSQALWSNTLGLVVVIFCTPLMGHLSDRLGRRPLLIGANIIFVLAAYPIFAFITSMPGLGSIIVLQLALGLLMSVFTGVGPVAVTELFPTKTRSLQLSFAYALGVAVFGGFAPYIATELIRIFGTSLAPCGYVIVAALISAVVIALSRETAHEELA